MTLIVMLFCLVMQLALAREVNPSHLWKQLEIKMQNALFYILLMLVAGLGIPTMAALNASLGNRIGSTFIAVAILLCFALIISLILALVSQDIPKVLFNNNTPWWLYCAGIFFVIYISSVTWVIPKFGVANSIGCVLFGQLIAMVLLDHFGAFGLNKYPITLPRLIGLIMMAAGIFIVVSDSSK